MTATAHETKQDPQPTPWLRQPNEGTKAFAAFTLFLNDGDQRSVRRVSRQLHKSVTMIGRWSSKHRWQERLSSWIGHQSKIQQDALDAEARKRATIWADREQQLREQRWITAQQLQAKAVQMIAFPLVRRRHKGKKGKMTVVEPADWNMGQAAKLMETADKLAALAVGAPTNNTALTGKDGEPIVAGAGAATVVIYLPEKEPLPA